MVYEKFVPVAQRKAPTCRGHQNECSSGQQMVQEPASSRQIGSYQKRLSYTFRYNFHNFSLLLNSVDLLLLSLLFSLLLSMLKLLLLMLLLIKTELHVKLNFSNYFFFESDWCNWIYIRSDKWWNWDRWEIAAVAAAAETSRNRIPLRPRAEAPVTRSITIS